LPVLQEISQESLICHESKFPFTALCDSLCDSMVADSSLLVIIMVHLDSLWLGKMAHNGAGYKTSIDIQYLILGQA